MKVAIVGRRNVGKSTLVNTLAQAERMIVSEVPGTTRDSVDVRFELDGKAFMAIDTPGFRRTKSITTDVDFYSTHRAQRSIRRADVVLLFFDATQRISKVDKQLCDYIAQQYKPCMFVVNKWDLIAGSMPTEKWVTYLRDNFRTMWYVADRVHHRPDGQERQGDAQPRADALPAVAATRVHVAIEQAGPGGARSTTRRPSTTTAGPRSITPPRSAVAAAHGRAVLQRPAGHLAAVPARICCGCSASELEFGEVPIKLYLRQREHGDSRDEIDAASPKDNGRSARRFSAHSPRQRSGYNVVGLYTASHLRSPIQENIAMIVGVPKEIKRDEYRVGLLPVGAEELTRAGHHVLVETGAGRRLRPGRPGLRRHGAELVDSRQRALRPRPT